MSVGAATARLLVQDCAWRSRAGRGLVSSTSMAKMYATDVARAAPPTPSRSSAPPASRPDHRVGRMYRDAKVLQIVEGSNDLHRALIGEIELGLRSSGERER